MNRALKRIASPSRPMPAATLQRKCACGQEPCGCARNIRGRDVQPGARAEATPAVSEVLRLPGRPLDAATRAFVEPRFGHDFSGVRVHTDASAAASARAINARAYTAANHVVFATGEYSPDTRPGVTLLAHELTHVVQQQRDGGAGYFGRGSTAEQEADQVAGRVARGDTSGPIAHAAPTVPQLQPDAGVGVKEPDTSPPPPKEEVKEDAKDKAPEPKKVCLTFDDGPQKGTEEVLDGLGGTIPGAFFLTGKNMEANPTLQKKLVERMINEGHQIGNHTFTHDPMSSKEYKKAYGDLSDPDKLKKFQENYKKNEQHFQQLLGTKSQVLKLARLPGNGRFVKVGGKLVYVAATEALGMPHVTWHFEFGTNGSFGHLKAEDWQGIMGVASEQNVLPGANNIILFHDRHWAGKKAKFEAILKKLARSGFSFGKLNAAGKCS